MVTDISEGKKSIESVLELLEISLVISVDDQHGKEVGIESIIPFVDDGTASIFENIFGLEKGTLPDEMTVRNDIIRQTWDSLDQRDRLKLGQRFFAEIPADTDATGEDSDLQHLSSLREIIGSEKLLCLSPEEWEQRKEEILTQAQEKEILFLFDQDLSGNGTHRTNGGINIIASIVQEHPKLTCGLLTHTVKIEGLFQAWELLSNEYNVPRDRFTVIPKEQIKSSSVLFAHILKLMAMSPDFSKLKEKVKKIISASAKKATKQIDEINLFDLDHIVVQTSRKEGTWEPEMLFRLHTLYQRAEVRKQTLANKLVSKIASRLRELGEVPVTGSPLSLTSKAWEIQREELYETGDFINQHHLPLELGDIFKKTDGESQKHYLLIAQPCELMVRCDGKRQPEKHRLPLIEIAPVPENKEPQPSWIEMPYYRDSEKWYLKPNRVHYVRACTLDLCVLNSDGVSKCPETGEAHSLFPSWLKRQEKILAMIRKELNSIAITASKPGYDAKKMIQEIVFKDTVFKGTIVDVSNPASVSFNCQRIERLSMARAMEMLMAFSASLSRPAHDREFGIIDTE